MIRSVSLSTSLVLLLLVPLGTPTAHGQAKAATEETFIKLQHDWAEARKKADMALLESFYAKEFTVGDMNGSESSRAADLAMFSSGDLKPAIILDEQMTVHIYDKAALVTGLEHLEGRYKGHSGRFDLRFANTFIHRDGRWQLVRHQATPVASR
jgi:ketosteroid isomerase-like protein